MPKRSLKSVAALVAGMCIVTGAALPATAAGNAASGRQIAERWCTGCHLVGDDQKSASTDVPSFFDIARRSKGDIDRLGGFLANPHPPMPNLNLTHAEIDDLLAYIGSLK